MKSKSLARLHPGDFSLTMNTLPFTCFGRALPSSSISHRIAGVHRKIRRNSRVEVQGRLSGKSPARITHYPRSRRRSTIVPRHPESWAKRLSFRPAQTRQQSSPARHLCWGRGVHPQPDPFVLLLAPMRIWKSSPARPGGVPDTSSRSLSASLLLALIVNFVYHRIAHWRLQGCT